MYKLSSPLPPRSLCAGLLFVCVAVASQTPPAPGSSIYSCTTADGKRLTSDRPIAECNAREQRILNSDGSLRTVRPPALSPEEKAAKEQQERKQAAERSAHNDAVRRDRNLVMRYPNEAAHQRARENALDDVNRAMQASERRIKDLMAERKPLDDEAEFYKGKSIPAKLKQQIDVNDASTEAQKQLVENQRIELVRVNALYDAELARLKKLWAGAEPGSLDAPDAAASGSATAR